MVTESLPAKQFATPWVPRYATGRTGCGRKALPSGGGNTGILNWRSRPPASPDFLPCFQCVVADREWLAAKASYGCSALRVARSIPPFAPDPAPADRPADRQPD